MHSDSHFLFSRLNETRKLFPELAQINLLLNEFNSLFVQAVGGLIGQLKLTVVLNQNYLLRDSSFLVTRIQRNWSNKVIVDLPTVNKI